MNESTIAMMKKVTMQTNSSQGKLIETQALINALRNGHLGNPGLDVYEQEEHLFFKTWARK